LTDRSFFIQKYQKRLSMAKERLMKLIYALSLLFLASCSTPEFRQAKNECAFEALKNFPVTNMPTVVTKTKVVKVPTGRSTCKTEHAGNTDTTTCEQEMRTQYIDYQTTVITDINEKGRDDYANQCAAKICDSRYGNLECKTK
jgi:hypothetical protein